MQRETGTTFILVTHDQDEALSIATRIGLLQDGRLAQVGTPADLYERPASRFVAAFMGAENILPARVRDPGPPALLDIEGIGPARAAIAAPPGPVYVALRPERLRLAPPGAEGSNQAQGTIAACDLPRRHGRLPRSPCCRCGTASERAAGGRSRPRAPAGRQPCHRPVGAGGERAAALLTGVIPIDAMLFF